MTYLQMKLEQWLKANAYLKHLMWGKELPPLQPIVITWHNTDTHTVVKANGAIILEEKLNG